MFASDETAATVRAWFDGGMSKDDINSKIADDYDSPLDLLSDDVKDAIANNQDGNAFVERLKVRHINVLGFARESAREQGWGTPTLRWRGRGGSEHPISVLSRAAACDLLVNADARCVDDVITF